MEFNGHCFLWYDLFTNHIATFTLVNVFMLRDKKYIKTTKLNSVTRAFYVGRVNMFKTLSDTLSEALRNALF